MSDVIHTCGENEYDAECPACTYTVPLPLLTPARAAVIAAAEACQAYPLDGKIFNALAQSVRALRTQEGK